MRFFTILSLIVVLALPASAQQDNADVVAKVVRIQNAAVAMQDALPRPLDVGSDVQLGDIISTGKDTRLELEFTDGTIVRLGERAHFTVVEYVLEQNGGSAVMRMLQGAFQVTSGKMMQLADSSMTVQTNTATIGIRGTVFWGGVLDNGFEVALLSGKGVDVKTDVGTVSLTEPGTGTRAASSGVFPSEPLPWGQTKMQSAISTVTFDN